jgi:diphosphomevalonate decarboxylase
MKATARANTNIALIKYWGKRDEKLFLPMNSSLSITLDRFYTTTTVEFRKELKEDTLILNNMLGNASDTKKVTSFLNKVRELTGVGYHASIVSENNVPTAAGFASSASGFAALATAATKALKLEISNEELSVIARQGSGSACRSIYGGYVEWVMGERADGRDSFARQLLSEKEWKLTILSVVVTTRNKKVSSRDGMKRTVETSPFYKGWLDTVSNDLEEARRSIMERDFHGLGKVMEGNALKMHATMMGAKPPVLYWESGTVEVTSCIEELRHCGIPAYFTIDAGPNVKVLCLPENVEEIKRTLMELKGVQEIITCYPGSGVNYML